MNIGRSRAIAIAKGFFVSSEGDVAVQDAVLVGTAWIITISPVPHGPAARRLKIDAENGKVIGYAHD